MTTWTTARPAGARIAIAVLGLSLIGLAGCQGTIPIGKLLDDPSHYDHQTVRIRGTVGRSVGVLGYGAYQVNDGTGTLTVVTKEGGAPREGASVGVEGEFRSAFTLGTESVAVVIEKERMTR
ncbi:MAG: hypothetical protein HYR74_13140 [Candidatus Eisenbacteria bacterium]|nr:hypothetical protein [Candidatus Eisenbacteria bacterium]